MKNTIIFAGLLIASVYSANAQQAFCSTSVEQVNTHSVINFVVPKEANISRYRIEAVNDSTDMAFIGAVKATGNSVVAKNYSFESYGASYKYYRIGIEGMGQKIKYSSVLTNAQMKYGDPSPHISKTGTPNTVAGNEQAAKKELSDIGNKAITEAQLTH